MTGIERFKAELAEAGITFSRYLSARDGEWVMQRWMFFVPDGRPLGAAVHIHDDGSYALYLERDGLSIADDVADILARAGEAATLAEAAALREAARD